MNPSVVDYTVRVQWDNWDYEKTNAPIMKAMHEVIKQYGGIVVNEGVYSYGPYHMFIKHEE